MTETGPAIPTENDRLMAEGHRLFAGGTDFLTSVFEIARLPPPGPLEVAFAGRSNVGKSSLINALCNRKKLAHTSRTPGRTQSLNVYGVSEGLRLVDMPGYGYARAPKDMVRAWTALIHAFLRGRATLRRVFVLIDARHGLKTSDHGIMDILDTAAVSYQVVLTKADKIGEHALAACVRQTEGTIVKRPAAHPSVMATSAERKTGIADLRAEIAGLLAMD